MFNDNNISDMANICTNMFYCSSDKEQNIRKIEQFISEQFGWDGCDAEDNSLEGEFGSRWSFPESVMEELISTFDEDDTLYIRVLSYEFGCEYVSFRVYRNGEWSINL